MGSVRRNRGGREDLAGWLAGTLSGVCGCVPGARLDYCLRNGASMRLHPKSRASTDHRPGPNIASAAAMVPVNRPTTGCSSTRRTCEISIRATTAPATGVHSPTTRRSPGRARDAELSAMRNDGSCHRLRPVPRRSTPPTTPRISSKPMPGQLSANVE
jgi:hypothetical protein